MAGWGDTIDRVNMWKRLAHNNTMIMTLIDHKTTESGRVNLQNEIEMEWTGTNMGHKVKWSHSMAKNRHIGGITMAVHPIIARYAHITKKCEDTRGWGRWTGIEIWGRKRKIMIIGTYGPTKNDDEDATDSMWYRQSAAIKKLPKSEQCNDPKEQYIADMNDYIRTLQTSTETEDGYEVILMGDINVNPLKDSKYSANWREKTAGNGLINTMDIWWQNRRHLFKTHRNNWIDHIYMSSKLVQDGSLIGAGIETGHCFYKSDHNMIGTEVNFTKLIGRIQGQEELYQPRRRIVKAGIKENKKQFTRIAKEREEKYDKSIVRWANEIEDITKTNNNVDNKKQIQQEIDVRYRKIVKEILAIEDDQTVEINKFGGKTTKHAWSDVFSRKICNIRLLKSTIRYSVQHSKRNKVEEIVNRIKKRGNQISDDVYDIIDKVPNMSAGESEWRKFTRSSISALRRLQKGIHLRARVKWRQQMKKWKYKKDEQRKNQHEVKKYYDYALKRKPQEAKPTVLYEKVADELIIVEGKKEIYKKELEFSKKHMGKFRERWYIHGDKMLPAFSDSDYGSQWRKDLQNGTLSKEQWEQIPDKLRGVFKCAKACINKEGKAMSPEMYGDTFTAKITLAELDRYIARIKKNTAPGMSGIRVDHIAALPDNMRKAIAKVLSIPYTTGMGYSDWKEEIVNWTPKEEGNPDINKRRPLMYYEVLRKICIGIRVRRVLNIWRKNGIIDENNYAFLTGKSTMQPLMIKKMILEEAKFYNKDLTLIDVDFSKAYDSTERFAKEISLRRMGFPEEGLNLWQMYDSNRNMHILTAHGITEGFTPECGAWGQGAVESPTGWLGFMCWMSAYVEANSKEPYIYGTEGNELAITKVIYADDGTYFQRSRRGGQNVMNSVALFATATGIIVKPTKSYMYSNTPGPPISIVTYEQSNTAYKLQQPKHTHLRELGDNDFFRHLGNIQNAKGENSINKVNMYDGTEQTNIFEKVKNNMKALMARNITAGGTLQVLKSVVIRQVLYPVMYSNLNDIEIDKIQRKIQTVVRAKMRIPSQMSNDILYLHEHMGGMGHDTIVDLVNMDRLIILIQCLEEEGQMKKIMDGAIHRLQQSAKITGNPLQTEITTFMAPQSNTWLYNLKVWMEHKKVTVKQNIVNDVINRAPSIIELCTRKTRRKDIWEFLHRKGLVEIQDMLNSDGTVRGDIWLNETESIKSEVRAQVVGGIRKYNKGRWPIYNVYRKGRWVVNGTRVGQIIGMKKKKVEVMEWKLEDKIFVTHKQKKWKKGNLQEAIVRLNENDTRLIHISPIIAQHCSMSDSESDMEGDVTEMTRKPNDGLWHLRPGGENYEWLMDSANDSTQTLHGVSDGSVKDCQMGGTFAWALLTKAGDVYQPTGADAVGWEDLDEDKLPTQEVHSYRMEAIGLLSVLTFLRTEIKWKGKLEWHMDAMSVISTFKKCYMLGKSTWQRQRDKDIWSALIIEESHWKGRVVLHHVESHVDKKKDENGVWRTPTSIQWMNIYVDKLADAAYFMNITALQIGSIQQDHKPKIYKCDKMITGNWRKQILEEIRIDNTKLKAKGKNLYWGLCTEEIEWGRMRKTSGNKTIAHRKQAAKLMNGMRATKDVLLKMEIVHENICDMCDDNKIETNRHIHCFCRGEKIVQLRRKVKSKIIQTIKEHKGESDIQKVLGCLYDTADKGNALNLKDEEHLPQSWQAAWNMTGEQRTWQHWNEGRAAEIAIKLGGAMPIWNGVITKAWMWIARNNISPEYINKFISSVRQILQEYAKESWKIRCETTYDSEKEGTRQKLKQIRQSAKSYINKLKMNGAITIDQVLKMNFRDKLNLAEKANRNNAWTQQTLGEMDFLPTTQKGNTKGRKRTQSEVQQTATKTRVSTQLIIVKGKLVKQQMIQPARKGMVKKKKKIDNTQVTLPEKWKIDMKTNKKDVTKGNSTNNKKSNKNMCPFRRYAGIRHDACRICDEGGLLVECHTCRVACHTKCGNMPINVQEHNVNMAVRRVHRGRRTN